MPQDLALTVTYIGQHGTIRMTPTTRFVWMMSDGSFQRLDGVIFSRQTGEFRVDFWRQTRTGRDYKRACGKVLTSVELPEDLAAILWGAIVPALQEAYRVPAGCVVTEEGSDSTEVPESEQPSYGVRYRQAGQVKERWFQTSEGREAWVRDMGGWISVTAEINPTTRKRLTDARLGDTVTRETHGDTGWMVQSDLSADLAQLAPHLGEKGARALISGVCSGLPLSIIWDTPFGEDRIERRSAVVLVSRLVPPHPTNGALPGRIRVSYWGFEHDIYVDRLVEVSTPQTSATYLSR